MALQLHCKRSKIFRHHNGEREEVVTCARGETTSVPDWVKDDLSYTMGLKDKSIVDLTPPAAVTAKGARLTAEPVRQAEEVSPKDGDEPVIDDGSDKSAVEPAPEKPDEEDKTKKPAKNAAPKGLQNRK